MPRSHTDPDYLINEYSEENLKRISSEIIRAYQRSDRVLLFRYARRLELDTDHSGGTLSGLFKKIILFYHPDRRMLLHRAIRKHHREGNRSALERFALCIRRDTGKAIRPGSASDEDIAPVREEYGFDFSREGWHSADFESFTEEDVLSEAEPEEYGFIEAVRGVMYGNLMTDFLPKDLYYLEGELILAEEGIEDLTGAEYCVNLTALDLSSNRLSRIQDLAGLSGLTALDLSRNDISDIDPLRSLTGLRSLDLSFNPLEDADALADLTSLRYLNLTGTGLADSPALRRLKERCLVIL